jgi:hypothetical protein
MTSRLDKAMEEGLVLLFALLMATPATATTPTIRQFFLNFIRQKFKVGDFCSSFTLFEREGDVTLCFLAERLKRRLCVVSFGFFHKVLWVNVSCCRKTKTYF